MSTKIVTDRENLTDAELTELTRLAKRSLKTFASLAKKSAKALWEAGAALSVLHGHLKKSRGWGKWLSKNGIAETTAAQAIQLFQADPTGEKIDSFDGITAAKEAFGIVSPKGKTSTPTVNNTAETITPPEPEAESVLRLVTKATTILSLAAELSVPAEDRDGVQQAVAEAGELLAKIGGHNTSIKVAA